MTNDRSLPTRDAELAVRQLIQSLEDSFNAHDAVALSGHYAEETAWATVMGKALAGRQEIAEFGKEAMQTFLSETFVRYEVVELWAIRPDVVAAHVLQSPTTASGEPIEGQKGLGLYVVATTEDGWKIVAGRVSYIADPPA